MSFFHTSTNITVSVTIDSPTSVEAGPCWVGPILGDLVLCYSMLSSCFYNPLLFHPFDIAEHGQGDARSNIAVSPRRGSASAASDTVRSLLLLSPERQRRLQSMAKVAPPVARNRPRSASQDMLTMPRDFCAVTSSVATACVSSMHKQCKGNWSNHE